MIVAPPFPKAVTSPALAPGFPPEFVPTGKISGSLESQVVVGELVTSLT
jgi:hypothetical protein